VSIVCTCDIRRQLSGISFLLPPNWFQGLNPGLQTWQQALTKCLFSTPAGWLLNSRHGPRVGQAFCLSLRLSPHTTPSVFRGIHTHLYDIWGRESCTSWFTGHFHSSAALTPAPCSCGHLGGSTTGVYHPPSLCGAGYGSVKQVLYQLRYVSILQTSFVSPGLLRPDPRTGHGRFPGSPRAFVPSWTASAVSVEWLRVGRLLRSDLCSGSQGIGHLERPLMVRGAVSKVSNISPGREDAMIKTRGLSRSWSCRHRGIKHLWPPHAYCLWVSGKSIWNPSPGFICTDPFRGSHRLWGVRFQSCLPLMGVE
jgi:hypothetical protein